MAMTKTENNHRELNFQEFKEYVNEHNLADTFAGMGYFDSFNDIIELFDETTMAGTVSLYTDEPVEVDQIKIELIDDVRTVANIFNHISHEGNVTVRWDDDSESGTIVIKR